jgi:hypothetical protein
MRRPSRVDRAAAPGLLPVAFSLLPWRKLALLALLALLTIAAAPAAEAAPAAQAGQRCFPETGNCIEGPIRRYWERNGGLATFGFPITAQRVETVEGRTIPVQWFERDRLEIQADGAVTAGRLGARALELQGRRWEFIARQEPQPAEAGCRFFEQTRANLCPPFLAYWERNGGLERFGYPLTEARGEAVEGQPLLVQYFERRRLEHHPENAGTRYEVLLGLLGNTVRGLEDRPECRGPVRDVMMPIGERMDDVIFRGDLVCPTESYANLPAAVQEFEGGRMFWLDLGPAGRKVIVYRSPGTWYVEHTYMVYEDGWREGDPAIVEPAPPYRSVPQRGFGKVWAAGERTWLGYATSSERPGRASVQYFGGGGFAILFDGDNQVWTFGPQITQINR